VTDDAGRADSEPVTVSAASATSPAPANAGDTPCLAAVSYTVGTPASGQESAGSSAAGGGGGGGGLDLLTLLALAASAYSSRCAASSHGRCARR
jgi:hypothetical protein